MDVNTATEKLTGLSRERLIGSDFADYFTEPEVARAGYQQAFGQGQVIDYPLTMRHTSGALTEVLYNASVYRNEQGEVLGVFTAARDITARKQAEDAVRQLNVELEQRVAVRTAELSARTAQLEAVNKELEAFSYSVSHDLRAPLRGIDGWSQALLEDYGPHLDAQGKTYLDRVRAETQRMGHLIDALLQLSRLTRAELRPKRVNLSALAQTIAAHLQEAAPERRVVFAIQPGLNIKGDAQLLEIALTNLLDNAFKFTGKTPLARIEFGQTEVEGKRAFFVRDNGAGFNMALAKQLFGAFQRLHRASAFPGTGIGLTTVQRVIHRHGGRIWAEAAVGQGATFYFTLEESL